MPSLPAIPANLKINTNSAIAKLSQKIQSLPINNIDISSLNRIAQNQPSVNKVNSVLPQIAQKIMSYK